LTYLQSSALLTQWKRSEDLAFLAEVSSVPPQQTLRHLQTAYTRFWHHQARHPRFKSRKKSRASAEYTRSGFRYRDGQLYLAKMTGPLAVAWSRPLPDGAEPSTVTVSRDAAGRWFVSLLCQCPVEPHPASDSVVGVDAGITSLVTLSTGEKIANPRHERRDRTRLARAQRRLARTQPGSANRDKARLGLAADAGHAGIQMRLVRTRPDRDRPLVPLHQDLLGVRAYGGEPAAEGPGVGVRALRYPA
jgi:putative transposase